MNKQTKIEAVMKAANVSCDVARKYLEAEEWLVDEAVFDIRAERNMEFKANIATLAALEALELMAKKAGVEPKVIMDTVVADPEGNTARYFSDLVQIAMREVPKLLAA
ncbi:hypothetical protein K5D56_22060 [Pseudomonas cichorii]|nr:hypothetical protein [Pseudomonas cichorii]MBX8557154.1 hypothetical protein [Pseudomonas cichorii]MBX8592053.1 hypothetical protein [Pseudomonas cichorii]